MKNWVFMLNFLDPATIFAYHLVSVHHDVIWYVILILTVVYWSLFKIIIDFNWGILNKQIGIFRKSYWFWWIRRIEVCFLYVWLQIFNSFLWIYFSFINGLLNIYIYISLKKKAEFTKFDHLILRFVYIHLGRACFEGLSYRSINEYFSDIDDIDNILIDRTLSHFLFNISSKGRLYYDGNDDFLTVHRFKHSLFLEYLYGSFPTIIIVLILIPSIFLIYSLDENVDPKFTIKVIGHQWFWSYEFDNYVEIKKQEAIWCSFSFDSVLINENELNYGSRRLLEVDKRLVVPAHVILRFVVTSGDVLHSWSIPEFGLKIDAVPGRLNQFIVVITRPGVFYGQCSELCGVAHGFMPIVVQAVPYKVFLQYLGL